jgi:hypothetical protein
VIITTAAPIAELEQPIAALEQLARQLPVQRLVSAPTRRGKRRGSKFGRGLER